MSAQPLEVLIVEDEVLLATELEYLLQELGCHTVGMAMNSEEAVAMAEALNPDLALVDVHLEDGPTGVDAARRVKHRAAPVHHAVGCIVAHGASAQRVHGNAVRPGLQPNTWHSLPRCPKPRSP